MLPTDDEIKRLIMSPYFLTLNLDSVCRKCSRTMGQHNGYNFACALPGKSGSWTSEIFSPSIDSNGNWILVNGGTWFGPAHLRVKTMTSQDDISLGKYPLEVKATVKPKTYKHQCPCGLIKCDYHIVEA
jgi:hypothetical protein